MSAQTCPSYAAVPGALLLGRLGDDGTINLLRTPLPVDEGFLTILREQNVDVDAAYRFAGPCHQGRCTRWSDGQCQVARQVTDLIADNHPPPADLPECGIREGCRWFRQQGPIACTACALVIRHAADSVPG